MKTIVTFIAGAVLASGLVYLMMSRNSAPPPPAVAQEATVQAPVATPEATEVISTPEASMPAAPGARSGGFKPSAMPKKGPVRSTPTVPSQQKNQPQDQLQTAQNTTPPLPNPTGGPMVPHDPLRSSLPPPPPDDKRPEPPKRVPKTVTIPAGTLFTVRVDQLLTTSKNRAGDSFPATLDQPVVVEGMVIAERGSKVEGRVVESDPGGRVSGLSQLQVELIRMNTSDGQKVKLTTESFTKQGQKETGKDVAKIGAAAGIGAAIGAIAGGGKGAGIGAAIGGAAGTGGVMATRGAAAQLPAETRVSFRLKEPITITERLD